jgi:hypothetical protein
MSLRPAAEAELHKLRDFFTEWKAQDHGSERPPYVLAFVNSRSGNQRVSQAIKQQFETLLGIDFHDSTGTNRYLAGGVCELSEVKNNYLHVRNCIVEAQTNTLAGIYSRKLRFLVCGGDGTVTWVLQELANAMEDKPELFKNVQPPIGIVPGGTGNDLARSLGWGPKLNKVADLVDYVHWALEGSPVTLDQWTVRLEVPLSSNPNLPPTFQLVDYGVWEGYFQNYFSVGLDASVTYGVEHARSSRLGSFAIEHIF